MSERPEDVERIYQMRQLLNKAAMALRDAEDYARLEYRREVLASRIREVLDTYTEDVLNGRTQARSIRWRAQAWDRLRLWRWIARHPRTTA